MRRAVICLLFCFAVRVGATPRLVVVISIDQFPYTYLERFGSAFGADGFNRLIHHGADFTNASYPYSVTETGPGHAAIGTGRTPSESGIVGNGWFDRLSGTTVYCTSDDRVTPPSSPVRLRADALGDRVQEVHRQSRVIGIAIKDRAAILMAGREATAAYWFDTKSATFTSSTYYRDADATVVAGFNATIPAFLASHPTWEPSPAALTPEVAKATFDPPSLRRFRAEHAGLGVSFPHPITSAEALISTPYGNGLVLGFAERVIDAEHLGRSATDPDVLYVGLSSQDFVGHSYGPDSLEVADSVLRTDHDLADFFGFLDRHFDTSYTVVLTADHGVQSIPEVAQARGRTAGRVTMHNPSPKVSNFGELAAAVPARAELEKLAAATLGIPVTEATSKSDELIAQFQEPSLYLNWTRIQAAGLDGERVKRAVRDAALKLTGVSGAWTNDELLIPNPNASPLERAVRASFQPDRSGDVLLTLREGFDFDANGTGATHGEPVEADQHVPLLFWGYGVRPGTYDLPASPTDIARSIGVLVGVKAGGADTTVLPCFSTPAAEPSKPVTSPNGADITAVFALVLEQEDVHHTMKWLAGPRLPDDVTQAVTALRAIAHDAELARVLPAGTLRLDAIAIEGDDAKVTVWHGPIPVPEKGRLMLACGEGTTYTLHRGASGWSLSPNRSVTVC